MPNPRRVPLSLAPEATVPDLDTNETGQGSLALQLEDILREQFRAGDVGDSIHHPSAASHLSMDRIPFCIRVTMEQMLDVAEDADFRAQMLEWSTDQMPSGAQVPRRVSSLRAVANDLRKIAVDLKESW